MRSDQQNELIYAIYCRTRLDYNQVSLVQYLSVPRLKKLIKYLNDFYRSWTNGYNGQKSYFINNSTLVYQCGSSIKFCDTNTGKSETFTPECINEEENTNGICLVMATTALNIFAYCDTKLSPTIYVHECAEYKQISKLIGKFIN